MILAQSLVEETLAQLLRWEEQLLRWTARSTFADTSAGHGLQICGANICRRQTNFGHLFINSEVRVPKSNWPLQMSCHGVEIQVFNQLYLESFKRLKSSQVTLSRCVLATIKDRFKKLNGCWLWFCYKHFLRNHSCFEIHRMDVSQNYSPFEESEGRAACQMHK